VPEIVKYSAYFSKNPGPTNLEFFSILLIRCEWEPLELPLAVLLKTTQLSTDLSMCDPSLIVAREINKGVYTYFSMTEAENFGFYHDAVKCKECGVNIFCEKDLNSQQS
jgi:hypothetical protein